MKQGIRKSVSWGGKAVMVALIAVLVLPALFSGPSASVAQARAQPALLAMAVEQPDAKVRVIAQTSGDRDGFEAVVNELGGRMVADLQLINAFAAEIPAGNAVQLANSDGMGWLALDAPVIRPSAIGANTVRDEFNQTSYSNNDGSVNWTGDWVESGDDGSPSQGYLSVYQDNYCAAGNCLRFKIRRDMSIERSLDLSQAQSATLSFDYNHYTYNGGSVTLEVSTDGSNWSLLNDTWTRGGIPHASFDLTPFLSPNTHIRFSVTYTGSSYRSGGYFRFDNIEVAYQESTQPAPASEPPNTYLDTLNVRPVWEMGYQGQGIGIAVIDSGIAADGDFSVIADSAAFGSGDVNDAYGHGTHVAGIAAGNGSDSAGWYKGVAPQASLIGVAISDATGMAYESDVVAGIQWVYDNKDLYNIRVVNMSFNSTTEQSYHASPMNAAAEILWFNGIVVVGSVGNKGGASGSNTANASPANDPFIITVGASHEQGTADRSDDTEASFSAHGTTLDGIVKPDIIAPGKNIYSVLSSQSSWAALYPERAGLNGEYFRLSGTSMSAPMVSGAAALLLQAEPNLTPDQVKYRLLHTASAIGDPTRVTYPYLDVYAAVTGSSTESANTGLQASQLLWTGDDPIAWDSVSWNSVSWNSVSWNSVSWNSVSWNSVSWNSVSWGD